MPSGRRGNRARIDRVEVPASRQNLRPSASRSAGWSGFDETPIEAAQKPSEFSITAGRNYGPQMRGYVIQNRTGCRPFRVRNDLSRNQLPGQFLKSLHRIAIAAPDAAGF